MDKYPEQKNAVHYLYPHIEAYDRGMLDVGEGHQIYYEQCGNPSGIPVVVFHGGPGGGCSPMMRRFFNPSVYRVILFDQRGCGLSKPSASVENNTTWHLVSDIERLRQLLGIEAWMVFGGSWGATLALIYAQAHPNRVRQLILRGVFLMTRAELDWFYGGGAGKFWPEVWEKFTGLIPQEEQGDLIAAYHRRLFGEDIETQTKYAQAWTVWENALASINASGDGGKPSSAYARAFARLENHYFSNAGFLEYDGQILDNMHRISHIPGTIVQGRYDLICPPTSAYAISQAWPRGRLVMVQHAGHTLSDPGIASALVRVMDRVAIS